MENIDLKNIPIEPTVTIFNPDGSELITTNDITTFTYIRLEIKKKKLEGYKVRNSEGKIFPIRKTGKIFMAECAYEDDFQCLLWPNGLTGEKYDQLLFDLISVEI